MLQHPLTVCLRGLCRQAHSNSSHKRLQGLVSLPYSNLWSQTPLDSIRASRRQVCVDQGFQNGWLQIQCGFLIHYFQTKGWGDSSLNSQLPWQRYRFCLCLNCELPHSFFFSHLWTCWSPEFCTSLLRWGHTLLQLLSQWSFLNWSGF